MNELTYVRLKKSVLLAAVLAGACLAQPADADDTIYKFKSSGKTRITGKVTQMTPESVTVDDQQIPASEIREIVFDKEPREIKRARGQMNSGRYSDAIAELAKIKSDVSNPFIQHEIDFIRVYSTASITLTGGQITAQSAGRDVRDFIAKYDTSYHLYPMIEQYGNLIFSFGKPDLAAEQFDKLAKSSWPEYNLKGLYRRGKMQIALGQYAEAQSSFDEILKAQSNDDLTQSYRLLGECGKALASGLQGNADAALKAIEKMIAEENADTKKQLFAELYNSQGAIYQKSGQLKEAAMSYLHTELLYTSQARAHAEALYHLALIWPKLEYTDRANRARDTLKSRYRNSYWAGKL